MKGACSFYITGLLRDQEIFESNKKTTAILKRLHIDKRLYKRKKPGASSPDFCLAFTWDQRSAPTVKPFSGPSRWGCTEARVKSLRVSLGQVARLKAGLSPGPARLSLALPATKAHVARA